MSGGIENRREAVNTTMRSVTLSFESTRTRDKISLKIFSVDCEFNSRANLHQQSGQRFSADESFQ